MPANLEATASKSAEASRLTGEAAVAPSAKKAVMARNIELYAADTSLFASATEEGRNYGSWTGLQEHRETWSK